MCVAWCPRCCPESKQGDDDKAEDEKVPDNKKMETIAAGQEIGFNV